MAVVNSSTFNFAEVVERVLQDYGYEVADEMFEALDEVSKETVKKLKAASRSAVGGSGEYASGWTRTVEKKRLSTFAKIHGKKPTYALAHLLEFGHANRRGGRTFGSTPAHPHIAEVNEWAQNEAYDRFVEKVEQRL